MIHYDINYRYRGGSMFKNGKKQQGAVQIRSGSQATLKKMAKGNKTADYTDPQPGCEYYFLVWYDTYTYELIYWEYLGDWCPDDGDNPYGNEGGGGGGGEWSPPDGTCSSCPPQLPPNEPPIVIPDIHDNLTDPCLKESLNDILVTQNINNTIGNLLNNVFGVNDKVNITYNQVTNLSNSRLANTLAGNNNSVDPNGNPVFNITVNLNANVLPDASKELIAVTILHEGLHGYFEYQGAYNGDALAQHVLMGKKYVDLLRASLQSVFPNLPNSDANALILGEMADIQTSSVAAFNGLAAEYGITQNDIVNNIAAYKQGTKGTLCQ